MPHACFGEGRLAPCRPYLLGRVLTLTFDIFWGHAMLWLVFLYLTMSMWFIILYSKNTSACNSMISIGIQTAHIH